MISAISGIRSAKNSNVVHLTSSCRFFVENSDFRRLGVDALRTHAPSLLSFNGALGVMTSVPYKNKINKLSK